ncbi:MAG: CHC2 zinc finger domain-containing protein, partial [Actinomycetota bacterium]|nr:CHC2 zinc finger domain-containing protein [Actinomycetota bacterium]
APRQRRAGGRTAVQRSWVLWADCDTPQASRALAGFHPEPSLMVRSGTGENRHAYWLLEQPIALDQLEALNLRLARTLGADERSYDAARILRVAGTHNHKHQPPTDVILEAATGKLHTPPAIAAAVIDVNHDEPHARRRDHGPPRREGEHDELLAVDPVVYVQALTGLQPGRDGKVSCPFHPDQTPSLHVYPNPSRGWYCYGCKRGGSIYDLAAELWLTGEKSSVELRGSEFLWVRERLLARFFGDRAAEGRSN